MDEQLATGVVVEEEVEVVLGLEGAVEGYCVVVGGEGGEDLLLSNYGLPVLVVVDGLLA